MTWASEDDSPNRVTVFPLCDCSDLELETTAPEPDSVRCEIHTGMHHPSCWLCKRGGCFQRVEVLRSGCEFILHGTILN